MVNLNDVKYEILFIIEDDNDEETHETMHIIRETIPDMNYKILFSYGNTVAAARNLGLEQAEGEYIWFIDGDDWIINPEVIYQVLALLKQNNETIVQIEFVSNYFKMEHYSMVWQYVFRKDFLEDIRFPNVKYQEDNEFMQKVFKKYGKDSLIYLNIPSYFYNYRRPGSNTSIQWGSN